MRLTTMKYDLGRPRACAELRRRRRLAASALAMAAALGGGLDAARAGPLDSRSAPTMCRVNNNGGVSSQGNRYDGFDVGIWQITVRPRSSSYPVPANKGFGQLLFSSTETQLPWLTGQAQGRAAPVYDCPSGGLEMFNGRGSPISGSDVYQTGVAGIGYRVYYYISSNESVSAPWYAANTFTSGALVFPFNGNSFGSNLRTRIDFVSTGDEVRPGTILSANVYGQSVLSVPYSGSMPMPLYRVSLLGNIVISVPTCSVSQASALNVNLPDINSATLAGSATGPEETRIVPVTCASSSQSPPTLKITSNNRLGSSPNLLANALTGANAAQGVGVQLQTIVPATGTRRDPGFGTVHTDLGQALGSLPASSWQYQFSMRYARTGAVNEIRAGALQTGATLTFAYN
ncbi:hypothetical protein ASE30_09010 [Achromobacter sp. Root83]|uniref:fimbrial protein n=1 Tax=Achromobacter sp. Root83 TaxID=1736602 RepID=UPI000710E661|nr:fimbrial protein [Achromobacter sp. Root83]KRC72965.1 hypothetical protein ASE30_09010 [Achromobacter sp. Root83]